MKPDRILLPLLVGLIFSSCVMTDQIRTLQIEILRPGIFNIPKDLTVAIIHRDLLQSDTCKFSYSNGYIKKQDSIQAHNDYLDAAFDHQISPLNIPYKYNGLYETKIDTSIKYSDLAGYLHHCAGRLF